MATLGRPAKGLPRYYMDVGWHRHPKWAGAPIEALFVHQVAVGYCTGHGTDGRMPADPEDLSLALGVKLSIIRKALRTLLDADRWAREGDRLVIVGFVDHNPVSAEVAEHAERQRSRGNLGNHKRWHEARGITDPDCSYCESPGESPGDDRQGTSPLRDRHGTASPGESLGMGWDGMGTDENQPADNSRPPATSPAGRPGSDPPTDDPPDTNALLTAAATILANAERDRRVAKGELDNPTGYRNSRIGPLRRENEQFWWLVLGENPTATAQQLADAVLSAETATATNGTRSEPQRTTPDGVPFIPGIGRAQGLPEGESPWLQPPPDVLAATRQRLTHPDKETP